MKVGIAFSDANTHSDNLPDLVKHYCRPEYVQKLCYVTVFPIRKRNSVRSHGADLI